MSKIIAHKDINLPFAEEMIMRFTLWHLRENIYCVRDSLELGNMLVCEAPLGLAVVDTKIDACYPDLYEFIYKQFGKPVCWIINTHCHPDHVGGNSGFCGDVPQIIAHANCAERLANDQKLAVINEHFAALLPEHRPSYLVEGVLTLDVRTELLTLKPQSGHTDGDLTVWCRKANVIHTGDLCSFGGFPYIGNHEGGDINNIITSLWQIYDFSNKDTIIIPGHGEPGDRKTLKKYIKMLATSANNVTLLIKQGATLDAAIAAPTGEGTGRLLQIWRRPINRGFVCGSYVHEYNTKNE